MSIRLGILALLVQGPAYGYQLRQEFEGHTGGTWPLNIGQVYTTLGRLTRDGLVKETARRDDGTVLYQLTPQGLDQVNSWWATPVDRQSPGRNELAIKLSLALTLPGVDVESLVQKQRVETMRALQEYTRLKRQIPETPPREDLAWLLILESLIYATEAEVRWLDHIEQRLSRWDLSAEAAPLRTRAFAPDGSVQREGEVSVTTSS